MSQITIAKFSKGNVFQDDTTRNSECVDVLRLQSTKVKCSNILEKAISEYRSSFEFYLELIDIIIKYIIYNKVSVNILFNILYIYGRPQRMALVVVLIIYFVE